MGHWGGAANNAGCPGRQHSWERWLESLMKLALPHRTWFLLEKRRRNGQASKGVSQAEALGAGRRGRIWESCALCHEFRGLPAFMSPTAPWPCGWVCALRG